MNGTKSWSGTLLGKIDGSDDNWAAAGFLGLNILLDYKGLSQQQWGLRHFYLGFARWVIIEELDKFICKGPLSKPILGTEKSIKSIALDEVQAFYEHYYKPSRMLVTITGSNDVDYEGLGNLFGKNTNRFKKSTKHATEYTKGKRRFVRGNVQQARIFMCYRAMPISGRGALTLRFVDKFFSVIIIHVIT